MHHHPHAKYYTEILDAFEVIDGDELQELPPKAVKLFDQLPNSYEGSDNIDQWEDNMEGHLHHIEEEEIVELIELIRADAELSYCHALKALYLLSLAINRHYPIGSAERISELDLVVAMNCN